MEAVKELFFRETLRRWHFQTIVNESGLSRERVNVFLKKLIKEKLIARIKPKGKMPYYLANKDSAKFRMEKKIYGLKMLADAGLFEHISSLSTVKTAILFGSFSRGDWNKSSDVDLFIYGSAEGFIKGYFESKLRRELQVFVYNEPKKIKSDLDPKVIQNIFKGFNIKGSLEPFEVKIRV